MDNKDDIDKNSPQEEGDQMPALVKKKELLIKVYLYPKKN